jgi:hypothetical protein
VLESAIGKMRERAGAAAHVPGLGSVRLPPPNRLVFYAGLGLLAVLEIVEWPIALIVGVGHLLADQPHWRLGQGVGEALEEA